MEARGWGIVVAGEAGRLACKTCWVLRFAWNKQYSPLWGKNPAGWRLTAVSSVKLPNYRDAFNAMRERGAHESGGSMPGGGESGGLQHMAHNENNVVGKRQLASSSQTINANLEADATGMVNMMLHALTRCITCRANTIVKPSLPGARAVCTHISATARGEEGGGGAHLQSLTVNMPSTSMTRLG